MANRTKTSGLFIFIVFSAVVIAVIFFYRQKQKALEVEKTFTETKEALLLLSENINIGMKSVEYINEYENSRDLIFKKQKP